MEVMKTCIISGKFSWFLPTILFTAENLKQFNSSSSFLSSQMRPLDISVGKHLLVIKSIYP